MYPSRLETENIKTSINLVSKDKQTNSLVLNNEALNLIRDLDGKIAVCVCIGQYRSGKSFLLSSLFKYLTNSPYNAFKVGHEEDRCTEGNWINNEIPILKADKKKNQLHLLFIDTEGIESNASGEQWDTKLFLFSLLISSLFIYNTKNNLTANDFKRLAVMSHLSTRLSLKSSSSRAENEKKLRNDGPDFLCVVRDFSLKEQYKAQESMNRFLEMEPTADIENVSNNDLKAKTVLVETKQRNEIRKNMLNSFKSFDCFRLPEPVSDQTVKGLDREDALQRLDSIKFDDLRDKFRSKFELMCEEIKVKLRPKCINETYLNGFKLAEFMKIIVNLINNDEIICLHDSLIGAIKREANFSIESCKLLYESKIKDFAQKPPVSTSDLEEKDLQIAKECLVSLYKAIGSNETVFEEFKKKFYDFRNLKFREACSESKRKNDEFYKQSATSLWEKDFKSKIDSLKTLDDFNKLFAEFKSQIQRVDWNSTDADLFWLEINDFIKSEKIKLDLVEKEKRRIEEEKRLIEEEKRLIEEDKKRKEEELRFLRSNSQRSQEINHRIRNEESEGSHSRDPNVGQYVSDGCRNGSKIYEGTNGGLYRYTSGGNKAYVPDESVKYYDD